MAHYECMHVVYSPVDSHDCQTLEDVSIESQNVQGDLQPLQQGHSLSLVSCPQEEAR